MPNKKLPKDVIAHWPEIFDDIEVKVIPVEYLDSIHVTFENSEKWVIEFDKAKEITHDAVSESLDQLFSDYEDEIVNVDFRLDTKKVKEDIQRRTRQFMKKRR